MAGDCTDIAPLWIPASWTLIASDLVFTDCHVWIAHSSSATTLHSSAISYTRQYINDFVKELRRSENAQ